MLVATLPAGVYAIQPIAPAAHHRPGDLHGIACPYPTGTLVAKRDPAGQRHRGTHPSPILVQPIVGEQDMGGRPGAVVHIDGLADITRDIYLPTVVGDDLVLVTEWMAVVPVDAFEQSLFDHVPSWHMISSDATIEVRFQDPVLTVGDLVVDPRTPTPFSLGPLCITPDHPAYSMLGLRVERSDRIFVKTTREMTEAVRALGDDLSLAVAAQLDRGVTSAYARRAMPTIDPAVIHLRDMHTGHVIRNGSPVHRALEPQLAGPYHMRTRPIDRAFLARIQAMEGPDAVAAAGAIRHDLKKRYADACFHPHVEAA